VISKHHKHILLSLVFFCSLQLLSATDDDTQYDYGTDTLTYSQYMKGEWEELYHSVKNAHHDDIDFYYLNLRGAFAAYYTERYPAAVDFFRQAEDVQEGDIAVKEIHYLSALYAGMLIETERCYEKLTPDQKSYYSTPESKLIKSISVSYGYNFNSDFDDLIKLPIDGELKKYGERILMKDLSFQDISLSHQFCPSLSVNHAYEQMTINRQQKFYYKDYNSNFSDSIIDSLEYDIQTIQWQYHINTTYNVNDKLFISPAFTLLHYNAEKYTASFNDTIFSFKQDPKDFYQYLVSLALTYKFDYVNISLSGNKIFSDNLSRWQAGGNITYFPLKSKEQYIGAGIYAHDFNQDENVAEWEMVWQLKMGWKISNTWFEINHSTGNHRGFADNNGLTVYNTYENIKSQTGANLSIPFFNKKVWLSAYYRLLKYRTSFVYTDAESSLETEYFSHRNHSITGNLTWYF
jgi:hypothetical protein